MKKVLLCTLALIIISWIIYAGYLSIEQKKIRDYSTLCMDKAKSEFWNLKNENIIYKGKVKWMYIYSWNLSDDGNHTEAHYNFYCNVTNKSNIEIGLIDGFRVDCNYPAFDE